MLLHLLQYIFFTQVRDWRVIGCLRWGLRAAVQTESNLSLHTLPCMDSMCMDLPYAVLAMCCPVPLLQHTQCSVVLVQCALHRSAFDSAVCRVSGPSPTTVEAFDIPCDIVASTGAQQTEEHPSILAAKANLDREVDVVSLSFSTQYLLWRCSLLLTAWLIS